MCTTSQLRGGVENAERNSNGFRSHPMRTCAERSGGAVMDVSYDITATLRAQMSSSHPPLVLVFDARGNGGVPSLQPLPEIIKTESQITQQ